MEVRSFREYVHFSEQFLIILLQLNKLFSKCHRHSSLHLSSQFISPYFTHEKFFLVVKRW